MTGLDETPDTTPPAPPAGRSSPLRGMAARIDRDLAVDVGILTLLALIALSGLHRVLDLQAWLRIGAVSILAGGIAAGISMVRRLDALVTFAVIIGVFLLAGGIAVPGDAIAGFLPGPRVPLALVDGLVHAWKYVITTAPPVPIRDGIGVIPYLFGFTTMAFGLLLARRTEQPIAPAAPGIAALIGGIILGTDEPVSILVQGSVFGLVVLAWGAVRANRERRSTDGFYWPRIVSGAAMLVVVGLVGTTVAGALPFAGGNRRVARKEIVPPFDPSSYASPLAGYRRYKVDRADDVLFRATGLPDNARIRLAVMDRYDGVVWTVSGGDASGAGRFERIGTKVGEAPAGEEAAVTFVVEDYEDVWIPTVDALAGIGFGGQSAEELERVFRYNQRTRAAASPLILDTGDRFDLDIRRPSLPAAEQLEDAEADALALPPLPESESVLEALTPIQELTSEILTETDATSAYERVDAMSEHLRTTGFFANGGADDPVEQQAQSGHSLMRLVPMAETAGGLVGDAEQYAALLAVMVRQLNMPARVVLGFQTEKADGEQTLTGDDLTAWVEVKFGGVDEWVPFDPTPDEDRKPEEKPKVKKKESDLTIQPPPPDRYLEPPAEIEPLASDREKADAAPKDGSRGFAAPALVMTILRYVGPPLLLIAAIVGLVLGAKVLRRRRRRTRGTAGQRVHGAWVDVIDHLRDSGLRPHPGATRLELAHSPAILERWSGGPAFATAVDAVIFSPGELDEDRLRGLWEHAGAERSRIRTDMSRWKRVRAALSLASLRRWRTPSGPPPPPVPRIPVPDAAPSSPVAPTVAVGVAGDEPNRPRTP